MQRDLRGRVSADDTGFLRSLFIPALVSQAASAAAAAHVASFSRSLLTEAERGGPLQLQPEVK